MTTTAVSLARVASLPLSSRRADDRPTAATIDALTFSPGQRAVLRAPACARRSRTIDFDVVERLYSFALMRWPHAQRRQLIISESMSLDPRVRPHTVTMLCIDHHIECLHIDNASERITRADVLTARLTLLTPRPDPSAI